LTDIHPQHLAPAVAADGDRDDDRGRDDAPADAAFEVSRVEPQIGPIAFQRPVEKGLDPAVDLPAQPADLALRDTAHPHRLDHGVDRAGRDALDVGFLNDRVSAFSAVRRGSRNAGK
jgi:hypothetical protein